MVTSQNYITSHSASVFSSRAVMVTSSHQLLTKTELGLPTKALSLPRNGRELLVTTNIVLFKIPQ